VTFTNLTRSDLAADDTRDLELDLEVMIDVHGDYVTQAENRVSEAEKLINLLQKEVDKLEGLI